MSRSARERFLFTTPAHLTDAAQALCVELNREYPYLAEFQRDKDGVYRIFSLCTVSRSNGYYGESIGRTGWDVEWIKRDGYYAYHQSSGGGSLREIVNGTYWRHPSMLHLVREGGGNFRVDENGKLTQKLRTKRLRKIPIDLDGAEDLMQYLLSNGNKVETYYCTVCKERLPEDENHCEHVWWCDSDARLRGPGSDDGEDVSCADADCWACHQRAMASAASAGNGGSDVNLG